MSERKLRLVPPLPTDPEMWKKLMNHCYGTRRDDLFAWLREVRQIAEEAEQENKRGAA